MVGLSVGEGSSARIIVPASLGGSQGEIYGLPRYLNWRTVMVA